MSNQNVIPKSESGTWKGVYLVRDINGHVKYDDPNNVPQEILNVLTPEDLDYLETLKTPNLT